MRETILIVCLIFLAFLFSGLAGILIGATLSPTVILGGAGILAVLLIVVIVVALWRQQRPGRKE
jgi:O-antigen ligase